MKKLIATMAAIVTGFAAWALPSGTSFEGSGEFSDGALVVDGTTWSTNGAPTLTEATYGTGEAYIYSGSNARYADFTGDNTKYLNIKTTFGQPLERLNDVTVGSDAVYFDQLVKFTAADEEPNLELYTGEKLVIYVLDKSELETPVATTNLMVVAGRYVNGDLSSTTYDFGAINVDAWHRLTIKAIKAYNSTALGFEIFLDGVALSYTGTDKAYDATAVTYLTTGAAALNQAQKIVASLVAVSTISAVGFDGQGAIDDVMATTTSPGTWADDKNVTLRWTPETLTALSYTAHGQTTTLDTTAALAAGMAAIPYMADMTIVVTPTFASNWAFKEFGGSGFSQSGMTLTILSDTAAPTIVAKDVTPRIEYVVGDTTNYYPTFAAALAEVSSGTLKLKMPVEIGLGTNESTEGIIGSGDDITIDLNGQTITGVATSYPGYIFVVTGGSLTIMDSSVGGTGSIVAGSGTSYAGVVSVRSVSPEAIGNLSVSGGTLEGLVTVYPAQDGAESYPAATASLTGGKYQYAANTESGAFTLAGFVAEGYAAAKDDAEAPAYWVVSALPKATVVLTYNSSKVTVSGVANGDHVAVGSTITVTATPATGYENPVITINGVVQSSYTVAQADVAGGIEISVAVSAIEWTITYYNDDDPATVFATDTYTIENRTSKALNDGTKSGYTFKYWQDEDGNEFTSANLAVTNGLITLFGYWEQNPEPPTPSDHTVTITWSNAEVGNPFVGVKYSINMGTPVDATNGAEFTVPDGAKLYIAAEMIDWYKCTGGTAEGGDTITANAAYELSGSAWAPADFTGDTAAEVAEKAGITSATLIAGGKDAVVKAVTWAEANHVPPATVNEMVFEGNDANTTAEKAYLFNVYPSAEAVAAAEAAFAFPSITPGTVPSIPPATTENYNGTVTVKGCATVNGTYVPATTEHKFYKAELLLPVAD